MKNKKLSSSGKADKPENMKIGDKKIKVTQTRSTSGQTKEVKGTLISLGLGRIGKSRIHTANSAIVGMLKRVETFVRVEY
jgi:large subunit ribosomal protein L30